jgi:hypothetical protein
MDALVSDRVGDILNCQTNWEELLRGAEWMFLKDNGCMSFWRRPGKGEGSSSAVVNYPRSDRLKCFSTSTVLPTKGTHDRFGFWVHWYWNGDFTAAANAFYDVQRGEGDELPGLGAEAFLLVGAALQDADTSAWEEVIPLPDRQMGDPFPVEVLATSA